jgi:hypothetical protein
MTSDYNFNLIKFKRDLNFSSDEERRIWLQDLSEAAISLSQNNNINGNEFLQFFPTIMSSNELLDKIDNALSQRWTQKSDSVSQVENLEKLHYRSNTMAHVCWHRNCSISAADYKQALTVSNNFTLFVSFHFGSNIFLII